jgi:hypothetical protein
VFSVGIEFFFLAQLWHCVLFHQSPNPFTISAQLLLNPFHNDLGMAIDRVKQNDSGFKHHLQDE